MTGEQAARKAGFFQMAAGGEGGLTSDVDRIAMNRGMPTLVIGLGGTGVDALLRMKYEVNRRLILADGKSKPDGIEYLALDTDEEKLNANCNGLGIDQDSEFCKLSVVGLEALIANPAAIAEEYQRNWLSPALTAAGGTQGANGKRQVGRFMLFRNAQDVVPRITRKIELLYDSQPNTVPMNVFILAGISGGTGAGTFLDVAYIVKQLLHRASPGTSHRVVSYLFLPDVNLSKPNINEHTRTHIRYNGYASLKELDYWMNAGDRGEEFKQTYTDRFAADTTPMSEKAPFRMCHLVSAKNALGITGAGAYDYAMRVAAESMINFISAETATQGGGTTYKSYLDNIETMLANQRKKYCANYAYTVIGADARYLQKDDAINYIAALLLQKVDGLFDNKPDKSVIENTIRDCNAGLSKLEASLTGNLPESVQSLLQRYPLDRVMVQGGTKPEVWLKEKCDSHRTEVLPNLVKKECEKICDAIKKKVEQAFRDSTNNKGPYYAHAMLMGYNNAQHDRIDGILDIIDNMISAAAANRSTAEQRLPDLRGIRTAAFNTAWKHKNNFFYKNSDYEAYLKAVLAEHRAESIILINNHIITLLGGVREDIRVYNNSIVDFFVQMLRALKKTFTKNVGVMTAMEEAADGTGVTYTWKVDNFGVIRPLLDQALRNDLDFSNNNTLVDDFLKAIFDKRNEFVTEEDMDKLGKVISGYIEKSFSAQITRSLEQRLADAGGLPYRPDPQTGICDPLADYVKTQLMGEITDKAQPMFELNGGNFNLNNDAVQYAYASVPASAINVMQGLNDYIKNNAGVGVTVKQTPSNNRIFWLNSYSGVPLFAYANLIEYETAYNIVDRLGMGVHLRMSQKEDWSSLPSPLHETVWHSLGAYTNPSQKEKNEEARAIFDKAYDRLFHWVGGHLYMRVVSKEAANAPGASTALWNIPEGTDVKTEQGLQNLMYLKFSVLTDDEIAVMKPEARKAYIKDQYRECFTRTANIMEKVKAQLELYEPLENREDEEAAIPEYAEALVNGAISIVGGISYRIQGDDTNAAYEIINLAKNNVPYPIHEVFRLYRGLSPQHKALLKLRNNETTAILQNVEAEEERAAKQRECMARIEAMTKVVRGTVNEFNNDVYFDAAKLEGSRQFFVSLLKQLNVLSRSPVYNPAQN